MAERGGSAGRVLAWGRDGDNLVPVSDHVRRYRGPVLWHMRVQGNAGHVSLEELCLDDKREGK